MSDIIFLGGSFEDYIAWQATDKKTLRRINELLRDIRRVPYAGIGKPEPLVGNLSGWWSRRIDEANRIVYRERDGAIEILQCGTHYKR